MFDKKFVILKVLFFIGMTLFGQTNNYKVQKSIYPSFKNDTIISKESYYKDSLLNYEKIYAYNGWQVLDSIVYDKNLCFKVYQPNYDIENKIIKSYSYSYSDCYKVDYKLGETLLFKDSFMILSNYYSTLEFALINDSFSLKKSENCYVYKFKVPDTLLLFSNYGIPDTEVLLSLSVKLKQNLILEDEFDYKNFNIKRKYYYKEDILKKVQITVWNKQAKTQKIFYDIYKYW